ncbi:MAG: class I SAM-dependent methyltransferase [Oscillospiraceae bacterium]|nr:class I SAM-dependent methyltransferase [Oscillospiraceae bacterium]
MRTADGWEDYRLIDASGGEKLEKWGDYTLSRPDPQIIWNSGKEEALWNKADAHYLRSSSGGGSWDFRRPIPKSWNIRYKNLKFKVGPTGFKHTGLFPEQAVNWDFMDKKIKAAGREVSVLNLFAYTGGATLACAAAGAKVCHVDAAKGMVEWARENCELSGLKEKPIRWIVDDCVKFMKREIRRGKKYDAIIMDPPSYGRGPGGEIWKLEDNIYELLKICNDALSEKPLFLLLNSYTTGLSAGVMEYLVGETVGKRFEGKVWSSEIGLPVETSGRVLPCGSTAVFEGE